MENPQAKETTVHTASTPPAQPQPERPAPQTSNQLTVDDSRAVTGYANFCRLTGTPEELIIDFGLNTQPFGTPTQPIQVKQRVVTNMYTAKRLLGVLQLTVQRHEAVFGALEIDVQKRAGRAVR